MDRLVRYFHMGKDSYSMLVFTHFCIKMEVGKMSRLRDMIDERGLDIGLLGAALNISDSEMMDIVDADDLSLLDDILAGELARVLDVDIDE